MESRLGETVHARERTEYLRELMESKDVLLDKTCVGDDSARCIYIPTGTQHSAAGCQTCVVVRQVSRYT